MWVGVLGPTVVRAAGPVDVPAAKHRALLAALVLAGDRPVPADALVSAVWGASPPPSAPGTLQAYISVIRRLLEPDLPARSPSSYLSSGAHGYLLHAESDATAFATAVGAAESVLTNQAGVPVVTDLTQASSRLDALTEALGWWRGEPYADLPDSDAVGPERARLAALHVLAREQRAALLLATGRDAEAVPELEALTVEQPLRERPWTLLAVALARTGRQADALAVLDRLRRTLDDELGLEPSDAVREVQTAILRQELPGSSPAATPTTPPSGPALPTPAQVVVPPWPLVGRATHLQTLAGLLGEATSGQPRFVSLVGDAGAGKTRLGSELALLAKEQDALVLVGRCSQEEDAPPLWPWTTALGATPGSNADAADHDAARFAVAEEVRRRLTALAADRPLLLGLEDLHWADPFSLRVLRHLCAHVDPGTRLMVVATWRPSAETSSPQLAETVAALARHQATRLELSGLSPDETSTLLGALTGTDDLALAGAVHRRTEGNPFFLVEYGRLARDEDRDLADVLDGLPPTVAAVIQRRIAALPADTAAALTAGAAIGREFGLDLLAPALGRDELAVLDLLEPALDVDLLQDLGADRFRFAHALVRESAYDALGRSRRERLHASLAALVDAAPDAEQRAAESARHWEAAGLRHVRRAHEAAARAGELALAAHAADEARTHLEAALRLHAETPDGTPRERFDLLVAYAEACRWSTRRLEMRAAVDEAVVLADHLGDPALVVAAVSVSTKDALWPARAYDETNPAVVAAIQAALDSVPEGDSPIRCRLLLALASEAYYAETASHVPRWCAEAVAMARRIGDDALLLATLSSATGVNHLRSTAAERRDWCTEALELAARAGDVRAGLTVRLLLATARCELADLEGIEDELAAIAREAHDESLAFVELISLSLAHSWLALHDDDAGAAEVFARLVACSELMSSAYKTDTVQSVALFVPFWDTAVPMPPAEQLVAYLDAEAPPISPAVAALALRHGRHTEARAVLDESGIEIESDNWFSGFLWAMGAEIGAGLHLPDLAAAAYARLLPYRGTCVMAGTSTFHGPVDAFLALAAAGTGELATATRHAEHAMEQIREWRIPRVERWFLRERERQSF